MHHPADDLPMITSAAEIPLVVGLESPTALEHAYVGDAVALLAGVRALGLPVPDGFVMTARGVAMLSDPADLSAMDALRAAWSAFREPLLLRLSACADEGADIGWGPRPADGSTWDAMLDGLCEILHHDLRENFGSSRRRWALAVMRRPSPGTSALVMNGDPFGDGCDHTILTPDGNATASLGLRRCRWLRTIADEAQAGLCHPVDLEVVFDSSGTGWVVDCLPYDMPDWL